jgi:hypothetical protein
MCLFYILLYFLFNGILCKFIPLDRIFKTVEMKFIANYDAICLGRLPFDNLYIENGIICNPTISLNLFMERAGK